jgi:hypothetical protein
VTATPASGLPVAPDRGRPGPVCRGGPAGATLTAEVPNSIEGCYGYTDSGSGYGLDPANTAVQSAIFAQNRPVAAGDLTLIWLGPLTCPAYRSDGTCTDGRVYDSERQELLALQLAQRRTDLGARIHVVIANAGPDFVHADLVAHMIESHRASFGRVVAIGGGEGRQVTKDAISSLVAAGIPFIAPNLTADQDAPGQPFLDQPGFLQLSAPNRSWADAAVSFIAHYTPGHRQVIVYHSPTPGDQFTESMARDVVSAAQRNPATRAQSPRLVSDVGHLPPSVCRRNPAGNSGALPAAVFFADRWTYFAAFVRGLAALCGPSGPALLISSDSVDRFMTNDLARGSVSAPWPMAYFRKGKQCPDLEQTAARAPGGEAAKLLASARSVLGMCLTAAGTSVAQIGDRTPEFWDAVALAARTVPDRPDRPGRSGRPAATVHDATLPAAASGLLTVQDGRVPFPPSPSPALCVLSVDLTRSGGRSVANCDAAFGMAAK